MGGALDPTRGFAGPVLTQLYSGEVEEVVAWCNIGCGAGIDDVMLEGILHGVYIAV